MKIPEKPTQVTKDATQLVKRNKTWQKIRMSLKREFLAENKRKQKEV